MNREDIIKLAREAGAMFDHMMWVERDLAPVFERFAALVAAHIRETEFKPDWVNYRQGLADGAAEEREAKNELLAALQDLLMDTQHSEHSCEDKNCPVAHATKVSLKYDAIRARGQA